MDRALQRDATLRYASASEFGRALSAAVRAQPTAAQTEAAPLASETDPLVPPTRVSESAGTRTSTPERTGPARQRWPLMATAGAIVVLLLVVGALFAASRKAATGDQPAAVRPAGETRPDPSSTTPTTSNGSAAGAATDATVKPAGDATDPVETGPANVDPRATPSSSARSRNGGETPVTTRSSPGTVTDVSARIPALLELARDDETTMSARREAVTLLPLAHGTQVVALKLVQVRSYAMKNEDARACEILQGMQQQSRGTEYETEVTRLLESCPR
jgi:hypothetical protein